MLATTRPARRAARRRGDTPRPPARRTRLRCPAWIAPMVGTNDTGSPRARQRATAPRTAAMLEVRIMTPDERARATRSIRLPLAREVVRLDVGAEALERLAHRVGEAGVAAYEL